MYIKLSENQTVIDAADSPQSMGTWVEYMGACNTLLDTKGQANYRFAQGTLIARTETEKAADWTTVTDLGAEQTLLLTYLAADLDDSKARLVPSFFPPWCIGTPYKKGQRIRHAALLYKCVQDHTAQADWVPSLAPSLWVRVDDPAQAYPQWRQPTGTQDAYAKGARVSHKEKHWICAVDSNVWEPSVFGWEEVTNK